MNIEIEYQEHLCFQHILSQNIAKMKVVIYGSVEVPIIDVNNGVS